MENNQGKNYDIKDLNEALKEFGSLQEAIAHLKKLKIDLITETKHLKQENTTLSSANINLSMQHKEIDAKYKSRQDQYQSLTKQIKGIQYQYDLVCGLVAMITSSPSVDSSLNTIIEIFKQLKEPGWYLTKDVTGLRSLFIHFVMGDYLKSFRCEHCGMQFITNMKPSKTSLGVGYYCPVCFQSNTVKPDDSFLKAMTSEGHIENIQHMEALVKELNPLEPFKVFFNVPCEICHELVKEWDNQNVKLVIQDIGCGHTQCWNSEAGQMRQLQKAIQKFKKDMK